MKLLARQILLRGQSVLARLVAMVRERAAGRVRSRLESGKTGAGEDRYSGWR